jgi:hypothetical protein
VLLHLAKCVYFVFAYETCPVGECQYYSATSNVKSWLVASEEPDFSERRRTVTALTSNSRPIQHLDLSILRKGVTRLSSLIRRWNCTARVFRSDSPGKAAQWLARSIRESWGVLWLVIRLLSVRADVSSSVIKAFFLVLSPPHLSACRSSPRHYQYFSYSASEDCHF